MKRILLVLLLGITSMICRSQENLDVQRINVRISFGGPIMDTLVAGYKLGEMRTRPQDGLLYRFNNKGVGQRQWDYVYFGQNLSIVSTLDQVLHIGNTSSIGITVGPSVFGGIKVPSLGVTGQSLMVVVAPDGTFSAQTISGGGGSTFTLNGLNTPTQFLNTTFNAATSPSVVPLTNTNSINLPIVSSLDSGIATPAQQATWNGKYALPGGGTTGQYINGIGSLVAFPSIPAQIAITDAGLFTHTGTYPNYTFTVATPGIAAVIASSNTLSANTTISGGTFVLSLSGTAAFGFPAGNTVQRPASPVAGWTRYNTDSLKLETYTGSIWLGGGSGTIGGGTTLQYIRGNGTLATTDTTMIPNFFSKVRSELTFNPPLIYVVGTGTITADTTVGLTHLATQAMLAVTDSFFNVGTVGLNMAYSSGNNAYIKRLWKGFAITETQNNDSSISFGVDSNAIKTISGWGVGGSGTTNLSITYSSKADTIKSSSGSSATQNAATYTTAGLETSADKLRSDSIENFANTRQGDSIMYWNGRDTFWVKGVELTNGGDMVIAKNHTLFKLSYSITADTSAGVGKLMTQGAVARGYLPIPSVVNQGFIPFWRSNGTLGNTGIKNDTANSQIVYTIPVNFASNLTVDITSTISNSKFIGISWGGTSTNQFNPISVGVNTPAAVYTIVSNLSTASANNGSSAGADYITASQANDAFTIFNNQQQQYVTGLTSRFAVKNIYAIAKGPNQSFFSSNLLLGIDSAGNLIVPKYGGSGNMMLVTDNSGNIGIQTIPSGGGLSNPMIAAADMIVGGTSPAGTPTRLPIGANGQFIKAVSGAVTWANLTNSDVGLGNVENTKLSTYGGTISFITVGTITTGTWQGTAIAAGFGGTGQTTYTIGDILYASSSTALSKLSDIVVNNVLISGGTGTAPSWGKIALAMLSATGTASSTTFLRGDNSWATIVFNNIYSIDGTLSGNRTISGGGFTFTIGTTGSPISAFSLNGIPTAVGNPGIGVSANGTFLIHQPDSSVGQLPFIVAQYTGYLGSISNISSGGGRSFVYYRIGKLVTVRGYVNLVPTTGGTPSSCNISLPISSAFSGPGPHVFGTATPDINTALTYRNYLTTSDVPNITFTGSTGVTATFLVDLTYEVD